MRERGGTTQVRRLAGELYAERRRYLLSIARRNAASEADAEDALQDAFACFISDYRPEAGAPPLAWLTLTVKRRCWRLRDGAHLDRRTDACPGSPHEEPTGLIERHLSEAPAFAERLADLDEARVRLAALKPDQRTALGMLAAGCGYEEIGRVQGWTHTKVNRCLYEGRLALREGASC